MHIALRKIHEMSNHDRITYSHNRNNESAEKPTQFTSVWFYFIST